MEEAILRQSDTVQANKSRRERKDRGVFYTPAEVIERMANMVLPEADPVRNPYLKVLDPACGTGLFLIKAFEILKTKFEENYDEIIRKNTELEGSLQRDGIGCFIVENNLWGADIDQNALDTARGILIRLAGKACRPKLLCCDSLLAGADGQVSLFDAVSREGYEFWEGSYDYIIGNPPYIGHKMVPTEYKKLLQKLYEGIYRDKSDISYCFLKKGIDLLREGGSLSYITSRYFMEGPSAAGLRKYIADSCSVTEVVDFYGSRVFKDAGIASCIITLKKGSCCDEIPVLRHKQGLECYSPDLFSKSNFDCFTISRAELKEEGWVLLNPERYEIFSKVEKRSSMALGDIADSYQGIITGCDRAFVVSSVEVEDFDIEKSLLKLWIKNSNIKSFNIEAAEKFLIYSDFIRSEEEFPNAIKYIERCRDKLEERRECRRGVRKWYHLQWGRSNEVFETPKIVYPYKCKGSRFAVDREGNYCSADVYSLKLKKKYEDIITLEYIAAMLNSRLFEFYFKCYAKKISEGLYDYYPNTVLRMKITMPEAGNPIGRMARRLADCENEDCRSTIMGEIDREVYKLYGLNEEQIKIVENTLF